MAEDDMERTEEATPRKRERARQEGNAPRSADVATATILVVLGPFMTLMGPKLAEDVGLFCKRIFTLGDARQPLQALQRLYEVMWVICVPVMLFATVAFGVGLAQTRVFTLRPLRPQPERINPFPNFKKVVPSKDTARELLKQVLKVVAIAGVVYWAVSGATAIFARLPAMNVEVGAAAVADILRRLLLQAGLAYALVAFIDYLLAVRKFGEDAKMSKEEVRDERKQEDINPEVRQRRRRKMQELLQAAPGSVRGATVVVTNPTHYAVALRYESGKDDAPMVLAKGADMVAMNMRTEARKYQIPMVENKPLARALYREGKVGAPIPYELYRATAEVIAFVYQLRQTRFGWRKEGQS